jgi:hypothetical protein
MSNKQQTAVDWLFLMLNNPNRDQEFANKLLQKAKEMEKVKAFEIFKAGQDSTEEGGKGFEQWYNLTYGGNK